VGEANFMVGKIVDDMGDFVKIKVNNAFLYSSEKVEGRKVVAVIRPEFVVMGKRSNIKESWQGRIENKVFAGSTVRYGVRTQNGELILVKRPFVSDEYRWNIGNRIDLSFPPSSILLYSYPKVGLEKETSME
jgi:ABC-type Fe3+/spermidine/putrescine transport system ATPase subunit